MSTPERLAEGALALPADALRLPYTGVGTGLEAMYDASTQLSDGQAVAARTRIVLRPLGSPLPLGLLAVAPAGLLLSCLQIGAFAQAEGKTVALIVFAFAVPLELIAAVLCFLARDTLGGSGLGIFAGAWLASGTVLLSTSPGATSPAFGVFLLAISAAMIILVASAAGGKAGTAVVMVAGSARFLLAGLFELTGSIGVEHAAAIVGFVLAGTCHLHIARDLAGGHPWHKQAPDRAARQGGRCDRRGNGRAACPGSRMRQGCDSSCRLGDASGQRG